MIRKRSGQRTLTRIWHEVRQALGVSRLAAPYLPRRPQETVLYWLVKEHLADFLRHAREAYAAPLPKYVENEFRSYLACGDYSRGFTVVHCEACDHHFAVAFSCKNRSVCPSRKGSRPRNTSSLSRTT
jgi:hypothetical protein